MIFSCAAALAALASAKSPCSVPGSFIVDDMHDGDQKRVTFAGNKLTIEPHNNNESWIVHSTLDPVSCNASVDFRVSGKPNPPPIAIRATLWNMGTACRHSTSPSHMIEFSDPTGKLASPSTPLNAWVEVSQATRASGTGGAKMSLISTPSQKVVYFDTHDGDQKLLTINADQTMTITPYDNNQTWTVTTAALDHITCSTLVDFNVPGKSNPPPVKLLLTATDLFTGGTEPDCMRAPLIFSDPSGTIAPTHKPLNAWVDAPPC